VKENTKLVHQAKMPVRWRDLDAFGHVNNSIFFTYFEHARSELFEKVNVDLVLPKKGPIIMTAECTFLKPILCPEELLIKIYAAPPGRSSFMLYYEIFSATKADVLYATGSTKVVWVDYTLGKSMELPEYIRQHLPKGQS